MACPALLTFLYTTAHTTALARMPILWERVKRWCCDSDCMVEDMNMEATRRKEIHQGVETDGSDR